MAGCEAVYSFTNIDGIQNVWSCTFVLSYPFVQRCLTKEQNNFTYVYNFKIEVILKYATKLNYFNSFRGS